MPSKSIFSEPFDDGTLFKLRIFSDYFKEWLPVFVSPKKPFWKNIQIYDLFAGMGKDNSGVLGSPLIILEELSKWKTSIKENSLNVQVIINEFLPKYYQALKENIDEYKKEKVFEIKDYNEDFNSVFERYYDSMKLSANFLFLDQNGIKQITETVFNKIIELKQTDFLFFISSSFIKRFSEVDSFQKYLKITKQDLEGKSYYHIHRIVLDYYRSLIPNGTKYFLAPFSIKKPAGIYGLIFGTNHIYGLEKFLKVCWKHDQLTGEANFDIDNEKIDILKPSLFEEYNIPKKIQLFENELEAKILNEALKTNYEVYCFSLEQGFLPKHSNKILMQLKNTRKIDYDFNLINSKIHKLINPSAIKIK